MLSIKKGVEKFLQFTQYNKDISDDEVKLEDIIRYVDTKGFAQVHVYEMMSTDMETS